MTQNQQEQTVNLNQEAKAVSVAGNTTTDTTKKDVAKNETKKEEGFGAWWDKNKSWLIPLLGLMIGGTLGYLISNALNSQDSNAINQVLSNIKTDNTKNDNQKNDNMADTQKEQEDNQNKTNVQNKSTLDANGQNVTTGNVGQVSPNTQSAAR